MRYDMKGLEVLHSILIVHNRIKMYHKFKGGGEERDFTVQEFKQSSGIKQKPHLFLFSVGQISLCDPWSPSADHPRLYLDHPLPLPSPIKLRRLANRTAIKSKF